MNRMMTRVREAKSSDGPAFLLRRGEIVPAAQARPAEVERTKPELVVRAPDLPVAAARSFKIFD